MRRITTWLLSTVSALVLLFSYHTSTSSAGAGTVALGDAMGGSGTAAAPTRGGGSTSSDAATPTPDPSASPGASDGSYTGETVMTRYGAVQVQITVSDGRISEAVATQVPSSNPKDQEINAYAVPILNEEAVQAQSADIDLVSGATYTSEGYVQSLQSAIDRGNL